MEAPRELATLDPFIVRNSDETTSVGSCSSPSAGWTSPPTAPCPLAPSRMLGQMTEWNTMLSLPMK